MNETPTNQNPSAVIPPGSSPCEAVGTSPVADAGDQNLEWGQQAANDLLKKLVPIKAHSDSLLGLTSSDSEVQDLKANIQQAIGRISTIIEHGLQLLSTRQAVGQDLQKPYLILGGCALDCNNCMVVVLLSASLLKTKLSHDEKYQRPIEALDHNAHIICNALKSILLTTRQTRQSDPRSSTA